MKNINIFTCGRMPEVSLLQPSPERRKDYGVVDLFSGCGGLALGFSKAGFNIIVSSDFDHKACITHAANFDVPMIEGDITQEEIKKNIYAEAEGKVVDVIIGGPPCQGFSTSGLLRPDDPRNRLFYEYIDIARHLQPKIIVLENVKGIVTSSNKASDTIMREFEKIGYKMQMKVLKASDYGVPQKRERAIFIGTRIDVPVSFPKPIYGPGNYITTADAIGDLVGMKPSAEFCHVPANHRKEIVERFKEMEEGQSLYATRNDSCRKLKWHEPSFTVKDNHGNCAIHPIENRSLTSRELARLQSFPDDFDFSHVEKKYQLRQIGNAVPPLLAYHIAIEIGRSLDCYYDGI